MNAYDSRERAAEWVARQKTCLACHAPQPRPALVRLLVVEVEEAAAAGDASVYVCKRCLGAWRARQTCPHCGCIATLYFDAAGGGCVGCEACVSDA
jgi:hypothetical protein